MINYNLVNLLNDAQGSYNTETQIRFKTTILQSSLYLGVALSIQTLKEYRVNYSKISGSLCQYYKLSK